MDDCSREGAIAQNTSTDRPFKGMSASMSRWFGLFHGWDYLYSDVVIGKLNWKTDRSGSLLRAYALYQRWKNGEQLIGVRFATKRGGKTYYLMLDIDRGSQYHPYQNEPELRRLLGVLETIGLCRHIPIRSSASEGIHIYFPLLEAMLCTGLALAVHRTLEQHGFVIQQGQLEIFPNVRSVPRTLYQGHRLPLQTGSYVLDSNWQPLHNSLECLIDIWEKATESQDHDQLKQAIASCRIVRKNRSLKLQEWYEEGQEILVNGWTGHGQTNQIVRDLCVHARVFIDLEWDAVEAWVVKTATNLPGYKQYCRHQYEIKKRVRDWIKTNRKSNKYYPAGGKRKKERKGLTNDEKKKDALQRIDNAIRSIKQEFGSFPEGATARKNLICARAECNPNTLYKHKALWHPEFECKGYVLPSSVKVSTASEHEKIEPKPSEECVLPSTVRVSAISQASLKNLNTAEVQLYQDVTHFFLLSVYSPEAANKREISSNASLKLQVGDVVRWTTYNSSASQFCDEYKCLGLSFEDRAKL